MGEKYITTTFRNIPIGSSYRAAHPFKEEMSGIKMHKDSADSSYRKIGTRTVKYSPNLDSPVWMIVKEGKMPLQNKKNVHPLEYQATSPEEVKVMKSLNEPMKALFDLLDQELPDCADKTVALRKMQELRMQVNLVISLNGIKDS